MGLRWINDIFGTKFERYWLDWIEKELSDATDEEGQQVSTPGKKVFESESERLAAYVLVTGVTGKPGPGARARMLPLAEAIGVPVEDLIEATKLHLWPQHQ